MTFMATPKSQRIGIWIIAIVLTVGTLGSFLVMGLSVGNQKIDAVQQQKKMDELQKLQIDYQSKVDAQTKELSDKYYSKFSQYSSLPAVFDTSLITSVAKKDLLVGDGEEINDQTDFNVYYIGWNPSGVVFDKSIENGALKASLSINTLIPGFKEGIVGMKMGGVREIAIPSDKAYGETGAGENIPPNTPIKFIVMAISKPESLEIPDELQQYYQAIGTGV